MTTQSTIDKLIENAPNFHVRCLSHPDGGSEDERNLF